MKTLTFYSGKLWHSDKPFPASPFHRPALSEQVKKDKAIQDWLSTAYEVVNPEVIPWTPGGFERCVDGDQITLPDGYGIKYTLSGRIEFKEVGHSEATTKTATITLPEKPENSAHVYTKLYEESGIITESQFIELNRVEPSESQEEMWKEVVEKISKTVESYVNEFIDSSSEQMRDDLRTDLEELKEKFTITRK